MSLFLLVQSNKEIKKHHQHITAHEDEDIYYRSYYGIIARPKATLPYPITGDDHVEWLANDVAVFTY